MPGMIYRAGGKRIRVGGKTARSADCCCGNCCPTGLPNAYTLTGHLLATFTSTNNAIVYTLCDSDFTLVLNGSGAACFWGPDNQNVCPVGPYYIEDDFADVLLPAIIFELANVRSVGTCEWVLSDLQFGGSSIRAGLPTNPDPTGAYPNITSISGGYTYAFTSLVIS